MAPKNKLTSPRKLEKALTEVARASGVPEERTAEALAAFAKIMVEKFGWNTPEKIASGSLGDAALLDAARAYLSAHPSVSASESRDPAATTSLAPKARKTDPKIDWQR